jgi:predicted permease
LLQDLRFGLKLLLKEKAFTAAALLTLALCIGANTAIFTVLHAVILDPLPLEEPGRLVTMYNLYPGVGVTDRGANGVPDYLDRRKLTDVFESVALAGGAGYDVGAQGSPLRIDGAYVTPSFFRVLRIQPLLGRTFTEDDAVTGKEHQAILSYGLWKDMFAHDPGVLGKDIRLSGVPYRIVGVLPERFARYEREARIWVPFAFTPQQTSDEARHSNNWGMIARLRPGVSLQLAQQRIDGLNRQNLERFARFRKLLESARFRTRVAGLQDEMVRDVKPTLYLLQAAVAFVLLIGCVNVANLLLVRFNVRMKEMAIRFSLGAGRTRLALQLLTESVTLAALGGALGLAVGYGGVRLLAWLGGDQLPRGNDLRIDGSVLLVNAGIALVTGLIFGSVPVVQLLRRDLNEIFRQVGRTGTSDARSLWIRSALVVCQISVAFVLLIGSALLTISFARLLAVDPGFQADNVLTARFSPPRSRYGDAVRIRSVTSGLLENLRRLPGVTAVATTTYLPFGGGNNSSVIDIVGHNRGPGENPPVPGWNTVSPGYFQALRIPLVQGRTFAEADSADAPLVVIIDQYLARKYWPRGDSIGAKITRGPREMKGPVCTIVGVVGSVKTGDLAEQNPVGEIYFPYTQFDARNMHLVVRTGKPDPQLTAAIRRELRRVDPELPLFDVKTMPERVASSMLNRRAAMVLCLIFAALALVLSAIGIYGVLAYSVAQRIREFGIRVALGAGAREVLGMVLGHGLKLAAVSLFAGSAAALALTRLMSTLLYGVKPADPEVFVLVATLLLLVSAAASFVPSVRALRIRPAEALRYE